MEHDLGNSSKFRIGNRWILYIFLPILAFISILAVIRFGFIFSGWKMYDFFFQKIRTLSLLPDYLNGAMAIWLTALTLIIGPTIFSYLFLGRTKKKRIGIVLFATGVSAWMVFLYFLGQMQPKKYLLNPFTQAANYNYWRDTSEKIHLIDPRYSINPENGSIVYPLTPTVAAEYVSQQNKELQEEQAEKEESLKEEKIEKREKSWEREKQQELERGEIKWQKQEARKWERLLPRQTANVNTVRTITQPPLLNSNSSISPSPESSKPESVLTSRWGNFLFAIDSKTGCKRIDQVVKCGGTVTNTAHEPQAFSIQNVMLGIYADDEFLDRYFIGSSNCQNFSTDQKGTLTFQIPHCQQYLEPNTFETFSISIDSVSSDAKKLWITIGDTYSTSFVHFGPLWIINDNP